MSTTIPHGTRSRYVTRRCRCEACTEANRLAWHAAKARRQEALDSAEVAHGTFSTYSNHGCRCEPCSAANRAKCRRAYQQRRRAA